MNEDVVVYGNSLSVALFRLFAWCKLELKTAYKTKTSDQRLSAIKICKLYLVYFYFISETIAQLTIYSSRTDVSAH